MNQTKKCFTLIELLCVVMIIALLAAISLGVTHLAFSKADDTAMKSLLEMLRVANEQYKTKYGFYLPNGTNYPTYESGNYYSIPLLSDFLGEGYEQCLDLIPDDIDESKKNIVYDPWGNPVRYRCPGKFNTGSYDIYSVGPDLKPGDEGSTYDKAGLGDDFTNFKNKKQK